MNQAETAKLSELLEQWNDADEFSRCIEAIEAIPEQERDYLLTVKLSRAYSNLAVLGDHRAHGTDGAVDGALIRHAIDLLESVRTQGENDPYWNARMGYSCLMAYPSAATAYEYAKRWLALAPDDPDAQKLVRDCEKYLEEEKIHVDIIITDIKMPIMDGMELIGMLNERFPDIKVIILTAYSDFTYAQQAIKFQVSDFVVKNDFFLELPRAVKKIIEQCEVDAKKCVGREKEIPFFQGEACRVCACEMRDIERYDYEVCKNRIEEILNSTFLDHKVVVAEGESGMLIFVIEYKGSEENAAWFQRRLEKVVSIAKIFQNIRLRIGAGKVVKSAEWGRVGKKQAIRNLSDIYTDNSPVNVKENYTEYIQYWKDENDVESYMRRLYVALRSGMEENKKLCAEEFEEYLKQETRPIEQCRSDTHAIILYLVRKVKSKEKMEKILVPEKALDAVYRSKSKAALAEVMRETCEAISTILEEEQKEGSSLSRKVNSIIERDYRGKISLKDIGKELFVNSSYLSRVYKKETGYTVTDAINSYRIEKAKEILETGEYRVCEVGEMVGIEDPAYFTHVFLKYEGKSPSDFMNR